MSEGHVLEVDHFQQVAMGCRVAGEVFLSRRLEEGDRVVSVLAGAGGAGVEASLVAHAAAAMALEIVAWNIESSRAAALLMASLPGSPEGRVAFTIVDAHREGRVRLFEHAQPPLLHLRAGHLLVPPRETRTQAPWHGRVLQVADFHCQPGDHLVACSAGLREGAPGWDEAQVAQFLTETLARHPDLGALPLAQRLVARAALQGRTERDLTCGVLHLRSPQVLHVLTGPPFDRRRDGAFADLVRRAQGQKVICGGSTAQLVSRELKRPLETALPVAGPGAGPAGAKLEGVALVTEGCLTLARLMELLEAGAVQGEGLPGQLLALVRAADVLHFHVGTSVNPAHQDPELPVELDLRRNIVRRLAALLEQKHLKQTHLTCY